VLDVEVRFLRETRLFQVKNGKSGADITRRAGIQANIADRVTVQAAALQQGS